MWTRANVGLGLDICGVRPDRAGSVEADSVGSDTLGPCPGAGQAPVGLDVEGGQPAGK
jgi:hypothetical protein